MREAEVRVILRDDFFFQMQGLSVVIGQRIGGRIHILRFHENGMGWWEPQDESSNQNEPTMVLPEETLVPLLDALTQRYHGASDTRQAQEALAHEQERRDKSEDALRQIALAGATMNLRMMLPAIQAGAKAVPLTQEEAKAQDHM